MSTLAQFKEEADNRVVKIAKLTALISQIRKKASLADFRMKMLQGSAVQVDFNANHLAGLLDLLVQARPLARELGTARDCSGVEGLHAWQRNVLGDLTDARLSSEDGEFAISAEVLPGDACEQIDLGTATAAGQVYELRLMPRWSGKINNPRNGKRSFALLGVLRFYPSGNVPRIAPWPEDTHWPREPVVTSRAWNAISVALDIESKIQLKWLNFHHLQGCRYKKPALKMGMFIPDPTEEPSKKDQEAAALQHGGNCGE